MNKKGVGYSTIFYGTGYGNGFPDESRAIAKIEESGLVKIYVEVSDVGSGGESVMWQIASQALNINKDLVKIINTSTNLMMDSGTAAASRQTYNTGNAVLSACKKLRYNINKVIDKNQKIETVLELKLLLQIMLEKNIAILEEGYFKANTSEIYKIAPFEYGIVDNLGKIRTNYGETLEKTVLSLNESRGKDPATWDEVLLDVAEVYENYTLVSTNHLQEFISFNEPYIESVTGHYACAVSALLACGAYYNAVDYTDIAGDYMDIWDSTGTTVSSESGGITYGSTTIGNIGPGFVDFCAGKNVSVTQNTDYSPNYNFFTNCIDRGDIAVVHCGIISSDTGERAGHSMAAEGYATLRAYNSGNTVHTLMVFDGWGDTVRYLNFDFDSWTDISGSAFNG